ncbi:MAG: BrnT family toxin [Sulfuricurvum sp.]|jgi:uncharacterized DUF497 family protein
MRFEYDPDKSASNLVKHGINFDEAQLVWQDANALEIRAKSDTENRFALIARIDDKLWIAERLKLEQVVHKGS